MTRFAVPTITPTELSTLLNMGEPIVLVDVREPNEWKVARIEGARLIPLRTVLTAAQELDPASDIVVYCHHGARSHAAAEALLASGFQHVRNLVGGIDRWSVDVDRSVARY